MKVRRFAEGTTVDVEKTASDIHRLLRTHGAEQFAQAWDDDHATIMFRMGGRMLRYQVDRPLPIDIPKPKRFVHDDDKRRAQIETKIDAEWRRRWRALLLILKAKLELVAGGDSNFEREFMADIMLPDGTTVGDAVLPRLAEAYESGEMPSILLLGSGS